MIRAGCYKNGGARGGEATWVLDFEQTLCILRSTSRCWGVQGGHGSVSLEFVLRYLQRKRN